MSRARLPHRAASGTGGGGGATGARGAAGAGVVPGANRRAVRGTRDSGLGPPPRPRGALGRLRRRASYLLILSANARRSAPGSVAMARARLAGLRGRGARTAGARRAAEPLQRAPSGTRASSVSPARKLPHFHLRRRGRRGGGPSSERRRRRRAQPPGPARRERRAGGCGHAADLPSGCPDRRRAPGGGGPDLGQERTRAEGRATAERGRKVRLPRAAKLPAPAGRRGRAVRPPTHPPRDPARRGHQPWGSLGRIRGPRHAWGKAGCKHTNQDTNQLLQKMGPSSFLGHLL